MAAAAGDFKSTSSTDIILFTDEEIWYLLFIAEVKDASQSLQVQHRLNKDQRAIALDGLGGFVEPFLIFPLSRAASTASEPCSGSLQILQR